MSHYVAQADLKPLGSSASTASAFRAQRLQVHTTMLGHKKFLNIL